MKSRGMNVTGPEGAVTMWIVDAQKGEGNQSHVDRGGVKNPIFLWTSQIEEP